MRKLRLWNHITVQIASSGEAHSLKCDENFQTTMLLKDN